MEIQPIQWEDDHLLLLDQTRLPEAEEWLHVRTPVEAATAIREMRVRGAPALGVTAAYAMALAAAQIDAPTMARFLDALDPIAAKLAAARPTAVNLGWAVQRCIDSARGCGSPTEARAKLLALARRMAEEDVAANRAIGANGAPLLRSLKGVLTHCNTGALATSGYGTALGVIRTAWEAGERPAVFCTETRPWLQGARLTAWELVRLGIPASLIVDSAATPLMAGGEVGAVVVGADRIAANGDVANKIGTFTLAVVAHAHEIPFYVAAPFSSIDIGMATGDEIAIEERPASEVTHLGGQHIAADGIGVRNPAFDVTPSKYVSAIITDLGVVRPPYESALRSMAHRSRGGAA